MKLILESKNLKSVVTDFGLYVARLYYYVQFICSTYVLHKVILSTNFELVTITSFSKEKPTSLILSQNSNRVNVQWCTQCHVSERNNHSQASVSICNGSARNVVHCYQSMRICVRFQWNRVRFTILHLGCFRHEHSESLLL